MQSKIITGVFAGVVAIALALGVYRAGAARALEPGEVTRAGTATGGISVSGEGSVDGRPDTAYINLGFVSENKSLTAAQKDSAAKMTAVLNKIKGLGVAEKDIQTSNYNIWRDTERGVYVVSNDVSVTIRNIASSSKLLDGAVAAGANSVNGISFGIENRAALEKQAREKAIANAKSKADELARITGVAIGAPIAVSEGAVSPPVMYERNEATADAGQASTPIEPGQLKVSISVQITYAIK